MLLNVHTDCKCALMILPEPITHRVSQFEARGGLQHGVCELQRLRAYILRDTRKHLTGHVKFNVYYLVLNSEYLGPDVGLATGDPDVATSDLRRPFVSLSLPRSSLLSAPLHSFVLFLSGQL
jgi:hypothetical protein